MSSEPTQAACDDVPEDLGEFAAGTLEGRRRAEILDHLEGCAECRAEALGLSRVVDSLLGLAPSVEPPAGFELDVMGRWNLDRSPEAPRRRHRVLVLAAAAVLVAAGFSLAVALRAPREPYQAAGPQSAVLALAGSARGHVWVSAGSPSWLYVTINDGHWSGKAWCKVTLRNGRVIDVGGFALTRGEGAWAARIDSHGVPVASAVVTNRHGAVLARARLST